MTYEFWIDNFPQERNSQSMQTLGYLPTSRVKIKDQPLDFFQEEGKAYLTILVVSL